MKLLEPQNGEFKDTQTGIVLFNHFGSTVSQDTGRDAQVLADSFNLPVLAVDRPGTAGILPRRGLTEELSTHNGYLASIAPVGKEIDRQIEDLGLTNIIATGRSAGGLGALALARSETVSSLGYIFAVEPVGCEIMPLEQGIKRYSDYLKYQDSLLDDEDLDLVRPLPPGLPPLAALGRLASIPPAMFVDRFHNKKLFATDVALKYSAYIAESQPQIDTTLEFAEHSMVATDKVYEHDVLPIAPLRKGVVPFEVKKPVGTVHASFDNREYMNKVIEPTILRALAKAAQS